jgi:hypothetical protein
MSHGPYLVERATALHQIKFIEIPAEVEGDQHKSYVRKPCAGSNLGRSPDSVAPHTPVSFKTP